MMMINADKLNGGAVALAFDYSWNRHWALPEKM
jgi:hypothetical protein